MNNKAFYSQLRKLGYKRAHVDSIGPTYEKMETPTCKVDVQFWPEGVHRAAYWIMNPVDGSGHTDRRPISFTTVSEMKAAIVALKADAESRQQ